MKPVKPNDAFTIGAECWSARGVSNPPALDQQLESDKGSATATNEEYTMVRHIVLSTVSATYQWNIC